uniref:FUN14 domain-containing protein 1 n=1 Tax=Castor canadensis TaxID=51338 RepID=A0A8C0X806_CASCN
VCKKTPLVESSVWPQFWTYGRKILSSYPDCNGWRDWLVCRIFIPEGWKLAATAVGGGFLLLQIASHSGYVQIDWKRVEKDVNKAKRQIKKRANKAAPEINNIIEEATEFIKQNIVISSGFVGGFLLGLAS